MSLLYKTGTRLLRSLPAESAHLTTVRLLRAGLGPKGASIDRAELRTSVGGLDLPNPVGLAAGFDKNADVPDAMLGAGFGFVECGTVTPRPQAGNPKPRLFRIPEHDAVINRMGFNNAGLDAFAARLRSRQGQHGLVGANLGANKDSDDRIADYLEGLTRLWGLSDYFTINISSPNTPGLRELQGADAMDALLERIALTRAKLAADGPNYPVFLKVAPDLDDDEIPRIVEQVRAYALDAIIVSNTTTDRPAAIGPRWAEEAGGLSGQPLFDKSTRLLGQFYAATDGQIDLIGVGGIGCGAQAYAKIRAGAKALQLYSALVFHGPQLVEAICNDLSVRLAKDGFETIAEAVGAG
ncbi:quinone-dependent dihydroorotate dehydrogenase [Algimonas porphyrae]|uniref:Dihydroorotate dehydrogenase (quinone) n=1 Tax=Algimonas porphyrae TaxID=1128113 RepID=A0ABQ5V2K8_9PROT|nr:quinone-dependent dihydroorotate dehydrogenase [Algimonas porphyrae]GLQ21703.1 dihydroorotate dehydrogenase (quinone) [Algimonas porphyrae]